MAEKEENPTEGDLPDGEGADTKILGLAKPLFIKVAIGVLVLIILGGAAAFFLIGSDEPPAPAEETTEASEPEGEFGLINSLDQQSKGKDNPEKGAATPAEMSERIMVLREEAIMLREENLQLREQIFALQTELTTIKGEGNPNSKPTDGKQQRKPDTAFLNSYGDDANAFPPIETDLPKPKPKPRWGEFKRPAS